MRAKAKAEKKTEVLRLIRKGWSYAAAAAKVDVDRKTARAWADAAGVSSDQAGKGKENAPPPRRKRTAAAVPPPPPPPPPTALAVVDTSLDAELSRMSAQRERLIALGDEAAKDGNLAAATKVYRDAAKLADTIARLASKRADAGDGVTFSRAELDSAFRRVGETIAALAASPECTMGVCPRCGEQIRIEWAQEPPDGGKGK